MKCLVLGGAGFLGSHLVEGLLSHGWEVTSFDKSDRYTTEIRDNEGLFNAVQGDFLTFNQFEKITKNVDFVFHSISTTIPSTSNQNVVFDLESNLIPTIKLLESCVKNNVKKVIFLSSGGTVYGTPGKNPIPEEHETNPLCSYGIHKLSIEKYLHLYHNLHNLDYAILRVSNPYGHRQVISRGQGVLTTFIRKAVNNETIEVWGDGNVVRDFIYVSDVISAALRMAEYTGDYKIFNVGSGHGFSIKEIISNIEKVLGKEIHVKYTEARREDVLVNVLDISRIKTEINWEPKVELHAGIQDMLHKLEK